MTASERIRAGRESGLAKDITGRKIVRVEAYAENARDIIFLVITLDDGARLYVDNPTYYA